MPNSLTNALTAIAAGILIAVAASSAFGQCQKSSPGSGSSCQQPSPVQTLLIPGPQNGSPTSNPPIVQIPFPGQSGGFSPGGSNGSGNFGNSNASGKGLQCEVRVLHPITFDWQSVRHFDSRLAAESFKRIMESRFWIVYQKQGNEQLLLMEALDQQDSSAKTEALKASGSIVRDVRPVTAQVVEESLQALLQKQQPAIDPARIQADLAQFTSTTQPQKKQSVANELLPLMGLWQAVTASANGDAQRVLLNLEPDGMATLTVPDSAGGETTINREFAIEDGKFILRDGENKLVIGEVISADSGKVVLQRAEGKLTFVRP